MKITNHIHLLKIDFDILLGNGQTMSRFVNVLIVFGHSITLIDTGVKESFTAIYKYIEEQGRQISEIETILLSHAHPDHIGSAAQIKADTNCKVLCHKKEQAWIENIVLQNEERPVPGFFSLVNEPVNIDAFIKEGDVIAIDKNTFFRIIETPGHSAGSVSILFDREKVLFTADAIPVKGDIPNYHNYQQLTASLHKIKQVNNNCTLLSSWASPLYSIEEIENVSTEAFRYLNSIDALVQKYYKNISNDLSCCKAIIQELHLPPFLVHPVVDNAFRSHL